MFFYKLISYLFHPLLCSFAGTFLYLFLSPEHIIKEQEYIILLVVFISTYLIPVILLVFLKRLKLIEDYHLRSISERKFPILLLIIVRQFIKCQRVHGAI